MANVYVRSSAAGAGTGADWANAYTTLAAAFTAKAAGDTFWVAADHAETQASAMTMTPPGTVAAWNHVYCAIHTGSVPPVSADLRTTATITTTANNSITLAGGYCYFYGITFSAGSGASAAFLSLVSGAGHHVYDSCRLVQAGTFSNQLMSFGAVGNNPYRADLINTTLGFGAVTHGVSLRNSRVTWRATASALDTSGSLVVPTQLFKTSSRGGSICLEGVDLSAAGTGKTIVGLNEDPCFFTLKDCKLNASVTIATVPTSSGGPQVIVTRSDASPTNYRTEKWSYEGTQTTETVIYRTGGASDGATPVSAKIVSGAGARWASPFEILPIAKWNATTASSVNVTIEGVWNSASLPNNDEVWFDVEYLGTSGNPLGLFATGSKANGIATPAALTASTQAWDAGVTARANSTAYSLGDVRKVASNAGRIFFCTTAGTSAASEPAGFASAVDGGSVTDGTAVFRAARRFKQTVAVTPQLVGTIYAYPKVGLASATVWIDPKMALA